MINMIDAKSDPIRPSDKGLNGGIVKDDALDSNDSIPPEGQAERDWYEHEARRQELEVAGHAGQGEEEAQVPLAVKAPRLPGTKEIEEHNLTHCPFRSWCLHCVKGQAKDDAHRVMQGDLAESDVVRVSMDYCYLTEGVSSEATEHIESVKSTISMTVLVMVETLCRSVWAYAVNQKGTADAWVAEQIAEDLEVVGLTGERIIVKTDQENSIVSLQRAVAAARAGHGTALENSRVGDSNSNGRAERAIQDVKGLIRTLRSALEANIDEKVHLEDPVIPWLVRHAGHIITMSWVRKNGRTAYQMMKGRRSSAKIVNFAETVMFKIPKTQSRVGEFEDRWDEGVWVGFLMRSGEHLVATPSGVSKMSTIRRMASDRRWSAHLVRAIVGTPGEPVPGVSNRRIAAFAKRSP